LNRSLCALIALAFAASSFAAPPTPAALSLAGAWSFRLDHDKVGVDSAWFTAALPDKSRLPGTTDENHFGAPNTAA